MKRRLRKDMFNQEKIKVLQEEFQRKADAWMSLFEHNKKIEEQFLSVKLAFTAFYGILFTLIFDESERFGNMFLVIFIVVIILIFGLLIFDFWQSIKDIKDGSKKQYRRLMLAKIRHIATIEEEKNGMRDYAEEAEKLLLTMENTRQKMFKNISIKEIIKYPKEKLENWNFNLWALLIMSIPILFLLKILDIF